MRIFPATSFDLEPIQSFLKTCDLPAYDIRSTHLEHFFVLRNNNQIVGSVGLEVCGEFGLLRSLALAQFFRGQGLGFQLVAHIEAYARSQQIIALYLLTTTADQFLSQLGYQKIERAAAPPLVQETAEFQSICPASAVCMFKEL